MTTPCEFGCTVPITGLIYYYYDAVDCSDAEPTGIINITSIQWSYIIDCPVSMYCPGGTRSIRYTRLTVSLVGTFNGGAWSEAFFDTGYVNNCTNESDFHCVGNFTNTVNATTSGLLHCMYGGSATIEGHQCDWVDARYNWVDKVDSWVDYPP
jgi:hypothetical protein